MGMEMGMNLGYSMEQKPRLNLEQRLALKQLLSLNLSLRHPESPGAMKGFEGLKIADQILKDKGIKGILIGGLSESIWNPKHSKKDFKSHKDVDVLVSSLPEEAHFEELEGGIDWWLPTEEELEIKYLTGPVKLKIKYFENAFNIKLSFGIDVIDDKLPAGLYMPSREFVVGMREAEVSAKINPKTQIIDTDVWEAFSTKINKKIKDDIAPLILNEFGNQYRYWVNIKSFDYETFNAIEQQ